MFKGVRFNQRKNALRRQSSRTLHLHSGAISSWMAMILGVLGILVLSFFLVFFDYQKNQQIEQQQLLRSLDTVKMRAEQLIRANMLPLEVLKTAIQNNPAMNHRQFVQLAESLTHQLHIQRLLMVPDLVVNDVYPPFSDAPLSGLEVVSEAGLWNGASQSAIQRKVIVSGPIDMKARGYGLVIWMPVLVVDKGQDRLWGVVGAVVDHQAMLADAGVTALMSSYQLLLKDQHHLRPLDIKGMQQPLVSTNPDQHTIASIQLPFGDWQLLVTPKKTPWYLQTRYLTDGLLMLALALMTGLAIWTYLRAAKQHRRDHKKLEFQRRYDAITKLPNRGLLLVRLNQMISRVVNKEIQPFALFYIDLDYFKQVNDMLGYPGGDQFLRKLSIRLKRALKQDDLLARSGSDEFVMTVQNIQRRDQAETVATDLLKELGKPLLIDGHAIASSCSIGIALYPRDGDQAITLLRHADRAMYQAKVIGRGTFCLVDKVLRTQSAQELKMRMELQQALQKNQFKVCYQPIIDLETGKVNKCEALITWRDNTNTSLLCNDYIAVAEQGGLIRHLGLWVLETVCKDIQRMQKQGVNLQIAVNRSSQEFLMPDASLRWLDILDKYTVPRHNIVFEITESLLMDEKEKTLQQIRLLKEAGINFAVDDFGTGYSAINYLRRFPVKYLKIDQSFIRHIQNKQDRVLVDIMIKLGQALNIQVIAEGVEFEHQYIALRQMGCHFIQGYYVAKPLQVEDLITFQKDEVNQQKWLKYATQY
jgi:diguanylate cyclase (GGDEF)-like protein